MFVPYASINLSKRNEIQTNLKYTHYMSYCHIIPQIYLKNWCNLNGKHSVSFLLNKSNDNSYKQLNISNSFGESNYYNLYLFSFYKEVKNNGAHQFLIQQIYEALPSFFTDIDKMAFKDVSFFLDEQLVEADKTFTFVYNFYSKEKKISLVDNKTGLDLSKKTVRHLIENEWNNKYKTILESFLNRIESNLSSSLPRLLNFLDNHNYNAVLPALRSILEFVAVQQVRNPNDNRLKKVVDAAINAEREIFKNISIPIEFEDDERKIFCLVQLLRYIKQIPNPIKSSKYGNSIDPLIDNYFRSTISFIKATKKKKFITSDNPVQSYAVNGYGDMVIFPITPEWCMLITGKSVENQNRILYGSTRTINWINEIIYESSITGVLSIDEKFKPEQRTMPEKDIVKMFKRINLDVSFWFN